MSLLAVGGVLGCAPVRVKPQTKTLVPRNEIQVVRYGQTEPWQITLFDGVPYLTVDQVARLSDAQLRWESVSQQACLGRRDANFCANWSRSDVDFGKLIGVRAVPLRFDRNQLFFPVSFVTSREFSTFSEAEFTWDGPRQQLTEGDLSAMNLPPIENLGGHYRLSLVLPKTASYQVLEKSPKRIWLRFFHVRTGGSQVLEGDDLIKEIRVVQRRESADLFVKFGKSASSSRIQLDEVSRLLTLDVVGKNRVPSIVTAKVSQAPPPALSKEVPLVPESALPPPSDKLFRTIIIDAGHGGKDSGATGVRGTYEKDINLSFAKSLADFLKKEKGIRVVMTRERDEFVPLIKRTDIANAAHGDVFVSVHCNASLSAADSGFEAYFLSPDATNEAANTVARLENSVVAFETHSNGNSAKLTALLASMAVYNFLNESSKCAALICRGVKNKSSLSSAQVREANFHVLRGAQMPGVLVELDYLTNAFSEVKLRSSRYRSSLVKGVAEGILTYNRRTLKKEAVASRPIVTHAKLKHER